VNLAEKLVMRPIGALVSSARRSGCRHDVEAAADAQVLCHPAQVHRHHQQVRDQLRASGWKWCSAIQNVL
jgi:hypothetical protein